jgi:hypothetical protein
MKTSVRLETRKREHIVYLGLGPISVVQARLSRAWASKKLEPGLEPKPTGAVARLRLGPRLE